MKTLRTCMAIACLLIVSCAFAQSKTKKNPSESKKVIIAYVTSWSRIMPDPAYMTHINYAFGHVSETFDGVGIANEGRLKEITTLKTLNPDLKILLSIGGWGSGRFSEMAASDNYRKLFAKDCMRVVKEYNLDGIDIDWEYPTSKAGNISASPDDTKNFTLMMKEIRKAIGKKKLLTLATEAGAHYIDFRAIDPYIDFVNIMSYDMAGAPQHHSALYRSERAGYITAEEAVNAHLEAGVPAHKLTMGMPFYGRGTKELGNFMDYKKVPYIDGYSFKWDDVAKVPYLADADGTLVLGYENIQSLAIKCQYIIDRGLLGGMYWDYDGDNEAGDLRRTVHNILIKNKSVEEASAVNKVLVLSEVGGGHGPFTEAGLKWLANMGKVMNFEMTVINRPTPITEEYLSQFKTIIQLDYPPYTWSKEAEQAFTKYIDEGRGGWVGFHHATLLGEFDGYPMWQWFSDFMGGIRFKNYIAPLADGKVVVEDKTHPVMQGVPPFFIIPDDEWYTFDKNPRPNVKVLATVDESSYQPASDIKMGDHPVVWVNESKAARNVYFLMGHSKKLFQTPQFLVMFKNAINWTMEGEK